MSGDAVFAIALCTGGNQSPCAAGDAREPAAATARDGRSCASLGASIDGWTKVGGPLDELATRGAEHFDAGWAALADLRGVA